MRAWVLLLVLTAPALAGCIGSSDEGLETADGPGLPAGAGAADVVRFDAAGNELPLPGELGETIHRLTGHQGAEPSMGITKSGAIFATADDAMVRSTDGGETWEVVYEIGLDDDGLPSDNVYRSYDPLMWVDPVTDIVYMDPMFPPLACTELSWSQDDGETWTTNPAVCHPPPMDHQKFFTGVPSAEAPPVAGALHETVLYQCYNQVASTVCAMSYDGGLTWPVEQPVVDRARHGCGGINGFGTVSDDGIAVVPVSSCQELTLAVTHDSGLTWSTFEAPGGLGVESFDADLAFDSQDRLYVIWRGDDRITYLARTPDLGQTWEGPWRVTPPAVESTMFHALSIGDSDKVGMAFLGNPDSGKAPADVPDDSRWHLYIVTLDDPSAADPSFTSYQVTPDEDPLQRGQICTEGIFCTGGRNLLEFIDTAISPAGELHVIYTDGCIEDCTSADQSNAQALGLAKLAGVDLH